MRPHRKPDARRQPKVQENHLPKSAAPEPMDVDAGTSSEPFVGPSSSGSTALRPRRPVPLPLSRAPSSSHLMGVLQALGTDTPAVGTPVETPVGTLVTKIQSSDCSACTAVDSTPTMIQGSPVRAPVPNVAAAPTQVLQPIVKLHPVLGIFVPTRRRS